jgi:hypothetical protein
VFAQQQQPLCSISSLCTRAVAIAQNQQHINLCKAAEAIAQQQQQQQQPLHSSSSSSSSCSFAMVETIEFKQSNQLQQQQPAEIHTEPYIIMKL